MTAKEVLATSAGRVTLWLPPGERLEPDPADPDMLWWIHEGTGGFSLATSDATAAPPDGLIELHCSIADRVDVEQDDTFEVAGRTVRELRLVVETRRERSWVLTASGERRDLPERVDVERLRRRFWIEAPFSAGYLAPEEAMATQQTYDRVLDSVVLET